MTQAPPPSSTQPPAAVNKWLLLLVATLTLVISVLAFFPVSTAWSWLHDPSWDDAGLRVEAVGGTVWRGSAQLAADPFPTIVCRWSLSPWHLLTGTLAAEVEGQAEGASFTAKTKVPSSSSLAISSATARVGADFINILTLDYGLELSQTFAVTSLSTLVKNGWPSELEGRITWPGGPVFVETSIGLLSFQLHAMEGTLSMEGTDLMLSMTSGKTRVMDITLSKNGWMKAQIRQAFIQLVDSPVFEVLRQSDGQGIAFTFEEKIF